MIIILIVQAGVLALVCVNAAMSAFFALCVLLGAVPARRALRGMAHESDAWAATEPDPRTVVVIPAHNEQGVIDQTIAAAQASCPPHFEILIVADNCTDATADLARARGVRVLERSHATDRGKGFALAAAFDLLKMDPQPPQVVLVLDADSRIDDRSGGAGIARFVRQCHKQKRPMQMASLIEVPADSRPRERIAAFAFRVKGLVRNLGLKRLGGGCQLGGTGMALPFSLVDGAKLASGETVEDMRLGIELAAAGSAPKYSVDCFVRSPAASSDSGFVSQRTRWEQGHLRMIVRFGPMLLLRGLRSWKMLLMGGDLCVPPLSLHVMLTGLLWMAGLVAAGLVLVGGDMAVGIAGLALASLSAAGMVVGVLVANWAVGSDVLHRGDLLGTVRYAIGKLGIYTRAMRNRERQWVRTERASE